MDKNRMVASLEKKLSSAVGHRADLQLGDVRKINQTTAHFLIAYAGEKSPNGDDIAQYFIKNFNAKVTPYMSTARVYENQKLVTVVASLLNLTRDYNDVKMMKPVIEGALYLDVPLEETWEVQEKEGGQKVLSRRMKDDIMGIVNARRTKMMEDGMNRDKKTTFAYLAEASNMLRYLAVLEEGDRVRVYVDGQIVDDAEVVALSGDEVKVKTATKSVTVPRAAVLEVVSKGSMTEQAMEDKVSKYFEQAYGDPNYKFRDVGYGSK